LGARRTMHWPSLLGKEILNRQLIQKEHLADEINVERWCSVELQAGTGSPGIVQMRLLVLIRNITQ
jgi:hypothetical protein